MSFYKFLVCFLLCWGSLKGMAQNARAWFDSAYQAIIVRQQYELGIRYSSKAIELEPTFAEAWNRRGYAKILLARYDEAITDLNEAVRLDPGLAKAHFNRGSAYYWKEQYAQAIPGFEKAIALDPKIESRNWAEQYAYALFRLNQFEKSLPLWDKAIGFNPGNAINWLNRGSSKFYLQRYDAALPDFNEAIRLDPTLRHTYGFRGDTYRVKKMYREAVADYEKAVGFFPQDVNNWQGYTECLYNLKRYKEVVTAAGKALVLNPKEALVWNMKGLSNLELKDFRSAVDDFGQAMLWDPKNPRYPNNRGYAWFMLGEYQKAISDYDKGAAMLPPKTDPFYRFKEEAVFKLANASGAGATEKYKAAEYLLSAKKYEEAILLFSSGINQYPLDARFYFGRYLAKYKGLKDFENRWKDAAKAMELDPGKPEHYYWLGYEYFLMKNDAYAIRCYDEAMKLGGSYLPGQNSNLLGNGNYKQVILNQRNTAKGNTPTAPTTSPGNNMTPQQVSQFLNNLQEELIRQLPPGATVVEKGTLGFGGKIFNYKLGFNKAYHLVLFYPDKITNINVIGNAGDKLDCEQGVVQGFRRMQCSQVNNDWYYQQTQDRKFHVMMGDQGPVAYVLLHLNATGR